MLKTLAGRFQPLTLQGDLPLLSSPSPLLSDFTGVVLSRNEPEVWVLFVEGEAVRALRYNLESSLFERLPSASPLDESIALLDGATGKAAYLTDPLFLKILLTIAEQRPSLFGSGAFVDIEKLVLAVERGGRDALLLVEVAPSGVPDGRAFGVELETGAQSVAPLETGAQSVAPLETGAQSKEGEEWAMFLFYGGKVIEGYAAENGSPGRDGTFNLVYRGDETPCRIIFYDLVLPRPGRASEGGRGRKEPEVPRSYWKGEPAPAPLSPWRAEGSLSGGRTGISASMTPGFQGCTPRSCARGMPFSSRIWGAPTGPFSTVNASSARR